MVQSGTHLGVRRAAKALTITVVLCFVMVFAGVVHHVPVGASQNQEFMPLSELQPGMKGIGKTVLEGTRIDTFDVEILGILKGESATGDLVLVRVSGKPVEAAGGIAAGMSGSPVYVNGRLVGAIAFGYESADHFIGLVTPIEEMLKVFASAKRPVPKVAYLSTPVQIGDRLAKKVVFASSGDDAARLRQETSDGTLVMVPAATPVMVSGASMRAFDELARTLKTFGLMPIRSGGGGWGGAGAAGGSGGGAGGAGEAATAATGAAQDAQAAADLQPGSCIGAQLVRGDVSVTAIGTVTYRQGNEVLALGHPLLGRGNASYFATGAEVHLVVMGDVMPFKVASPLGLAGTIVQDRTHGILVDVGRKPPSIPVAVSVRDRDTGVTRMLRADIVRDDVLSTDLVGVFTLSCLDATVDRIGPGTSRVSFQVDGKGLPKPIVRDNMFYSASDVSAESIGELCDAVATVIGNEFADVEVTGVKAEFDVEEARRTARIHSAEATTKVVKPGDTLEVKVRLVPFRGIAETKVVKIGIPEDTPPGTLYLTVRGGGVPPADEENNTGSTPKPSQPTLAESLENLVQEFMSRERNCDIVVEFYPGEASFGEDAVPVDGQAPAGKPVGYSGSSREVGEDPPRAEEKTQRTLTGAVGEKGPGLVKATLTTGYVIEGETTVEVEVEDTGAGGEGSAAPLGDSEAPDGEGSPPEG
ncbi:MAG: SpoIVB peptidase S55 domain-containing protein [Betaproteobacteria bacterium]